MDNTHLIKSNVDSYLYRGLSNLDHKIFPVKHNKMIPVYYKNNAAVIAVRSGLTITELDQNIRKAIEGEDNDFTSIVGGSAIAEDNADTQYIILVIFGMVIGLILLKLWNFYSES